MRFIISDDMSESLELFFIFPVYNGAFLSIEVLNNKIINPLKITKIINLINPERFQNIELKNGCQKLLNDLSQTYPTEDVSLSYSKAGRFTYWTDLQFKTRFETVFFDSFFKCVNESDEKIAVLIPTRGTYIKSRQANGFIKTNLFHLSCYLFDYFPTLTVTHVLNDMISGIRTENNKDIFLYGKGNSVSYYKNITGDRDFLKLILDA